jgi:hypothetical protein
LALSEVSKSGIEKANELLRSGRLVFLKTVGYSVTKIEELGDLAILPSETVSALLHQKAEVAIAEALGESLQKHRLRARKVGGKKRKRK